MGNVIALRQARVLDKCLGTEDADMTRLYHVPFAVAALAAISLFAGSAEAACFKKSASGTNTTIAGAKSQVYEALLQSFDWGAWASWMASGSTPGYRISAPSYSCKPGGIGYNCVGTATICKG